MLEIDFTESDSYAYPVYVSVWGIQLTWSLAELEDETF